MAEIDTSIYRQQPQQNPLQTITQIGGAADALGNIAVGNAVQQAIDPNTGQIDRNQLAGLLKGSTAGSMKAIPTLDALERLRSAGFQADQQGLETFQKRMAITHHLFSGLASKERPSGDDVLDIATRALDPALEAKKYGITVPVVMNAIKSFKGPDGKWLPTAQIKQKALEIQTQAASTSEILSQHSPGFQVIDRGGNYEIVPTGTAERPATGTMVRKNLPPPTIIKSPQGDRYLGEQPAESGVVSPADRARGVTPPRPRFAPGRSDNFGGEIVSAIPDTGPGAGTDLVTGRPSAVPPRQRPPTVAGAPAGRTGATSPAAGAPAPQVIRTPTPTGPPAGLRPGYTEAASGIASASAATANALASANDSSMSRKAMLGNLEDHLTKFSPGPGAETEKFLKSFAVRNLPIPEDWKKNGAVFDVGSIADQEQFNKQAMMLAQAQFQTIGGTGTDAKFSSAFETSPNQALSRLGNKGIIRLLRGNEDALQAKFKAWQKYKQANGPDSYPEFNVDFNEHFDPRAFQFKYMKPDERHEYIAMMEPTDREDFLVNLTHARKAGWISFGTPKK